ncbi:DNA topoisomerase III [Vibrio astriarenae]|nr:DNA topoisomerase III [Vibrio sp. C7]
MLGMINERTLANQGHKASFYYELYGQFEMAGRSIKAKLIPDEKFFMLDDKRRITSSIEAAATKEVDTGAKAFIKEIEQKDEKRQPPMLFNLSKLQIEASKRWGYKPKRYLIPFKDSMRSTNS